jgi:hypothetical protein
VHSFVLASTSMLFWVIFLPPFFVHGRTMWAGSVRSLFYMYVILCKTV